jgi:hypothetical protein
LLNDETINISTKLISGDYRPKQVAMSLDESNFKRVNEMKHDSPTVNSSVSVSQASKASRRSVIPGSIIGSMSETE